MINIKPKKIRQYNELIRTNRVLSRRLERTNSFPRGKLEILIEPIIDTNYSNLVKWSGKENAMYLTKCLYDFNKNWILFPNEVKSTTFFNEDNKKNVLIKNITDCFEPHIIHLKPMIFFKDLEKKPFFDSMERVGFLEDYGQIQLRYDLIYTPKKMNLSLLGNWVALRDC